MKGAVDMAETTVYSIRVPEEIKERISKNQQESGQSPAKQTQLQKHLIYPF